MRERWAEDPQKDAALSSWVRVGREQRYRKNSIGFPAIEEVYGKGKLKFLSIQVSVKPTP
jgi:hypothetical protein